MPCSGSGPLLLAAVATAVLCFSRFLSYLPGIDGAGQTLGAWWRLLTESSDQPAQLFLMVLLVYEPVAVVIAALAGGRHKQGEAIALFAGWSIAAFAFWSFSAGRGPEHAVHVVLPLVMLGGIALGASCTRSTGGISGMVAAVSWRCSCSASWSGWPRSACSSPGSTTREADRQRRCPGGRRALSRRRANGLSDLAHQR